MPFECFVLCVHVGGQAERRERARVVSSTSWLLTWLYKLYRGVGSSGVLRSRQTNKQRFYGTAEVHVQVDLAKRHVDFGIG